MMSESDAPSSILRICECSVCYEILREPKTLNCEHSFCKECLEGCVEFDSNSTIPFVLCPTCREKTSLENAETVSGLKGQLILRQILDGMEECKSRHDDFVTRCNAVEGKLSPRCCQLSIEWYCCNCKSYFCKKCFNLHSLLSSCGIEFYEIKYCEESNMFAAFCGRHNTFHRFACLRCTTTFCSYCKTEHLNKTEDCKIVSYKEYGSKFKDPLLNKILTMKDFKTKQKSALEKIDQSSSNIQVQDEKVKKYIDERKLVVLSQVLFLLQFVGKQVQSNFNNGLKEYELAKQKLKDGIQSKLKSVEEVLTKSEALAESSWIEIISQTKDLQDEFHQVLPEEALDVDNNPPELRFGIENEEERVDSMDSLFNAVQALFGDMKLDTMSCDGSLEPTVKVLNTNSNNVECSSSMLTKLNCPKESTKYISKVLKQMGLLNVSKPVSASATATDSAKDTKDVPCASSDNNKYVPLQCGISGSCINPPLIQSDGTLLLSDVLLYFPGAVGLCYPDSSGNWHDIHLKDGVFYPPKDGWGEIDHEFYYHVIYNKKATKTISSHEHPLILQPREVWNCDLCATSYSCTESYYCQRCDYDACSSCVNSIRTDLKKNVVHILSHEHALRLSNRKKWTCQVCGKGYRSTESYFCGACKYDACVECVSVIGSEYDNIEVIQGFEDFEIKPQTEEKEECDTVEDESTEWREDLDGEMSPVTETVTELTESKTKYTAHLQGLPLDVKRNDIVKLFKGLKVGYVHLPKSKDTGKFAGFGYVDFFDSDQFLAALSLNGKKVGSRQVRISVAQSKKPKDVAGQNHSSNESEDSAANQSDGEYSNQSGYTASNRQKKKHFGKRAGKKANRGGFGVPGTNQPNQQVFNDPSTADSSTNLPHKFEDFQLDKSGSESDDENESTTDGGGENAQRGRKGNRRRGGRNNPRGGRGGMSTRGGPGRGGPGNRGNRGGQDAGNASGQRGRPHQRPAPANSMPNINICFRCGDLGHVINNCPLGNF